MIKKQVLNREIGTWRIPLCVVAWLLLPGAHTHAEALGSVTSPAVTEVQQQKRAITGVVADSAGEPIIGANVREKGNAANGTITDIDGNFKLSVSQGAVLEVTYIGYVSREIPVKGNTVSVVLSEDTQTLEEVVVTGFGLAQKKVTLTGAISSVNSKELERSSSSTVSGALVGKIAGLNTRQTDGRPGSSTQLKIRNMGTPLFVIDGIQSEAGQFNNLDFNDIESISILKDASAAIYGVRAANGVVVVTTKKGQRNSKNTVSINAYYGMQDNFKFVDPADAKTYVTSYVQAETLKQAANPSYNRKYTREEYDKWMAGTEKGYEGFDWYDYIWKSAPQSYTQANISGGSDKSNYYVSVGHIKQDATVRGYGGFDRSNVQMNIDTQINDRLKVGAGMNGRIETRENPGVPGGDDFWLPRFAVLRNTPVKGPYANGNPLYPQKSSDDTQSNFAIWNYERSGSMKEVQRVMQLQTTAEYQIIKGLKAKAMAGYYYADKNFDCHEFAYTFYKYDAITDTYPVDQVAGGAYREKLQEYTEEVTSNVQLAYETKLGSHALNAVLGLESSTRNTPMTKVISIPVANNMDLINFKEIRAFENRGEDRQARLGWMGRVNYSYADKYLMELSGRYDGSWKFAPGKRWGFFPAASMGWRISEENFWKESKMAGVFSDLKLRGSYGSLGDDNGENGGPLDGHYKPFDYMTGYNYAQGGSVIDGAYVVGTQSRGLPATNLSWIKAKILDIGLDASFLNGRLSAQFDYFNRKRTGLPASRYDVLLPQELGFGLPKENLNSDVHRGIDGLIRWADNVNDFNYSIAGNATYARFYDWDQYDSRRSNSWDTYRNSIHQRYGYVNWGLEAIGQFQNWEEIAAYTIDNDRKGNTTLRPGDIKYNDINGDKVINDMDQRPIGYRQDSTPILNFGLNFACKWKGMDFAADFSGSALNTYSQQWEQQRSFQNNANNPQWLMDQSWRLSDIWDANSELIPGKYPMMQLDVDDHNYWGSTFWKHNVVYMKLRNLELGYTVPAKIVSKAQISNLRLYVAGTNLFALTNVPGCDPEQQDDNGLGYPTMRVINFGVNLKF